MFKSVNKYTAKAIDANRETVCFTLNSCGNWNLEYFSIPVSNNRSAINPKIKICTLTATLTYPNVTNRIPGNCSSMLQIIKLNTNSGIKLLAI